MPARAEAIRSLARRVIEGSITFGPCIDGRAAIAALSALPGIGDWTAEYIAMRALGEPDAFPRGDLVLRRLAGGLTARELDRRSEAWRPWRAYAVMLLWQSAVDATSFPPARRLTAENAELAENPWDSSLRALSGLGHRNHPT